jgi:large repetitive protein
MCIIACSSAAAQTVSGTFIPLSCNGNTTTITASAAGFGGTVQYSLNGGALQAGNTFVVNAGTYTISATDGNATATTTVAVTPNSANYVVTPTFTNIACNGSNTGAINVTISDPTFTYNGNINEVGWGSAAASNAGGAAPGFGAGHELNAMYVNSTATDLYIGLAGDVQDQNRIIIFIDCKAGGYNNGSFSRTGAPFGVNLFNSGTSFDPGFDADYAITIGTNSGHNNFFFDLFPLTATGGGGTYLGDNFTSNAGTSLFGLTTPHNGSATQGFEARLPWSLLGGAPTSNFKIFALYSSDGGFLSNQFLTPATAGSGNYGSGVVSFSAAPPNPFTLNTYSVNWSNGATTNNISGLSAGTYTLTVSNSAGCTSTSTYSITQPTALVASATTSTIACHGNLSTVTTSATGGVSPYTGTGTQSLAAGNYTIAVSDFNGCIANTVVNITQPSQLTVATTTTNPFCFGDVGTANAVATGGVTPYTGAGAYQFSAGTYTINVSDFNGCTTSASVTITEPPQLVITATVTPILCFGASTNVLISATGGSGILNGTGNFSANAGLYSFTVSDGAGCSVTTNVSITQPDPLLVLASVIAEPTCFGSNATVQVDVYGGTPQYTGGGTVSLPAGTHTITVSDANNCTASTTITITQPPSLLTASGAVTNIACFGGVGTASITATGGVAPYSGDGIFNNLTAGNYTYTVSDAAGCSANAVVTISSPLTPFEITASVVTPIACAGGTTSIDVVGSGGTPIYTGNVGTFTNSAAGTYTFTASDNNNCTSSIMFTLTEPPILSVVANVSPANPQTLGNNVSLQATSATANTYAWTHSGSNNSANNPFNFVVQNGYDGIYTITVTNSTGCTSTSTVEVLLPSAISLAVKAMLSGPFNVSAGLMRDSLRHKNMVPLIEPYSSAPYNTAFVRVPAGGGETATSSVLSVQGPNAIVDWVFVQLRDATIPSTVVASRAALIQRDGDIVDEDGNSALEFDMLSAGNYYVAVLHRNHLGIMSANTISLANGVNTCDLASTSSTMPLYLLPSSTNAASRIQSSFRTMYAGNCSITSLESKLLSYGNTSNTDKTRLQTVIGTAPGGVNGYSIFDCDLNGNAQFNGLLPDRLVILSNCNNSNTVIVRAQLP